MKKNILFKKFFIFLLFSIAFAFYASVPTKAQEYPSARKDSLSFEDDLNTTADPVLARHLQTVRISTAGLMINLHVYKDSAGNVFIPLNDADTGRLMEHFRCRFTYLVPMQTIVLGFSGSADFRMKLNEVNAEFGKERIILNSPPILLEGKPLIPLEALEKAFRLRASYDEVSNTYFLDPVISDVSIIKVKEKIKLFVQASGPVKYATSVIEEPKRYVIYIDGAILENDLADKDLYHPDVGNLFLSQESYNPNRIRIVIPLDKGVAVEMVDKPKEVNTVQAWLYLPQIVAPVQDMKQERITDLRVQEMDDRVILTVMTTGPVQYEWRRLLPPDNRYFVDIPNTLYTAPEFNKAFDVGYLKNIKVEQYRSLPDPVVRVSLDLYVPSKINLLPNPDHPQEIRIEILSETINPQYVERQGFGVTRLPTPRGILICIDPGHGGGDPGAVNQSYGLFEKQLTLDISFRLAKMLRQAGWNVVMTRTTDRDVSYAGSSDSRELSDRVSIANQTRAQIFVSIHINASTNPYVNGTSVHYYKEDSAALARHVHDNLIRANGRRSVGVLKDSFFVIHYTNMPAVLVECAFISNPEEAALLSEASFRQQCAEGIFNGLISYAKSRNLIGIEDNLDSSNTQYQAELEKKKAEAERKIKQAPPIGNPEYSEK